MFRISCFGDEISPDFGEQMEVMQRSGVRYLELRGAWGKNVLDLSDAELHGIRDRLRAADVALSSVGSPIGKVDIGDDWPAHLEKFRRAVDAAVFLDAPYIRLFSFDMPPETRGQNAALVIARLGEMLDIAAGWGLRLLHENEAGIFGQSSANCRVLLEALHQKGLGAVFDPSNFVEAGEEVYAQSFAALGPYVEYMHIKDSIRATGQIVVAGAGDGHVGEILNALRNRDGMFLSLEPHLSHGGQFAGFTGPARFEQALFALRELLERQKISYS